MHLWIEVLKLTMKQLCPLLFTECGSYMGRNSSKKNEKAELVALTQKSRSSARNLLENSDESPPSSVSCVGLHLIEGVTLLAHKQILSMRPTRHPLPSRRSN